MRYSFLITLFIFSFLTGEIHGQDVSKVYYHNYNNGVSDPNSLATITYGGGIVYLSNPDSKIRNFMDYNNRRNVAIVDFEGGLYGSTISFDSLPIPDIGDKVDTILGYVCNHAVYKVFSNRLDIWYTEDASIKGSPYRNYIPTDKALVLKVVINGNRTLIADSIVGDQSLQNNTFPIFDCKLVSDPELEEIKIRSRYTTIPIFENETINFDPDYWKDNVLDSSSNVYHFSKGAVIMKKIKLPESIKTGAEVFANLSCWSAGDAYDRTGSVFIILPNDKLTMLDAMKNGLEVLPLYYDNNGKKYQGIVATDNYSPPIEVMRFFTSFGVGHFNNLRVINNYPWENVASYKQDITALIPSENLEIWIGVFIGNYDKGGHRVDLDLDIYPPFGPGTTTTKYVDPLFNTVNIMEMSGQEYGRLFDNDTLTVNFNVPDNLEDINLLYTSTGHGGWGGGDEFNPKLNQIFLDGKLIYSTIPWRTDCATYRLLNPASGNFGNGMSSSDLSRSNWCPATLTPPDIIKLDTLAPGNHTIEVVIDQGENQGGSFNHWSVTGIITGKIK